MATSQNYVEGGHMNLKKIVAVSTLVAATIAVAAAPAAAAVSPDASRCVTAKCWVE